MMTDVEKWTKNRRLAELFGWTHLAPYWESRPSEFWGRPSITEPRRPVPDFFGDMNAALKLGERLREMGLFIAYVIAISKMHFFSIDRSPEAINGMFLQAPAHVRAQAALDVLEARTPQNRPCRHERLDEDGICRSCGEDCRGAHSTGGLG